MSLTLEIGNTSYVVMRGVKNTFADEFDDGATLTFILFEPDGTTHVLPQVFPSVMYNEPGGTYVGQLDADIQVKLNHTYIIQVDGIGSNGEVLYIRDSVKAIQRGDAC